MIETATRLATPTPREHQLVEVRLCRDLERMIRATFARARKMTERDMRPHLLGIARATVTRALMHNLTDYITPKTSAQAPIFEVWGWIYGNLVHVGYVHADRTTASGYDGPVRVSFVHLRDLERATG